MACQITTSLQKVKNKIILSVTYPESHPELQTIPVVWLNILNTLDYPNTDIQTLNYLITKLIALLK